MTEREFLIRVQEYIVVEEDGKERSTWKFEQFVDGWWQEVPVIRHYTDLRSR